MRCHHIHSFGGLQSATYVPYHLRSSIRTDVRCHHILLLDCCFCFIITKGKYQQIFHFGPSLPGILTRPHRVLRYSPAVRGSNTAERGRGWIFLLLGGCVRGEAAPVPLIRTAAPRCWVYCIVATSRVSPVYRSSARSPQRPACVFPGRVTEAVEAAHVPVHPP